MGIFNDKNNNKKSIPFEKLREVIEQDKSGGGIIPRSGGKKFSSDERKKMSHELFNPALKSKYGSEISEKDFKSIIQELENAKKEIKDPLKRINLDEKIRYLKDRGGIKP